MSECERVFSMLYLLLVRRNAWIAWSRTMPIDIIVIVLNSLIVDSERLSAC